MNGDCAAVRANFDRRIMILNSVNRRKCKIIRCCRPFAAGAIGDTHLNLWSSLAAVISSFLICWSFIFWGHQGQHWSWNVVARLNKCILCSWINVSNKTRPRMLCNRARSNSGEHFHEGELLTGYNSRQLDEDLWDDRPCLLFPVMFVGTHPLSYPGSTQRPVCQVRSI